MGGSTTATIGGAFALASALCWAAASLVWMRLGQRVAPLGLNVGKGLVALVVLVAAATVAGWPTLSPAACGALAVSGLIGIALGDTAYFAALVRLGPRRMLVVTTLVPVVASGLAMLFLDERPTWAWALGAALCLGGIALVLLERLPGATNPTDPPARGGVALAFLTVLLESLGIFLSKVGLRGSGEHGALDATLVRIAAATLALVLYGLARGELVGWLRPFASPRLLGGLLLASFVGTVLGIGFSMVALHLADVSLSAVLNATSPLFILPLAAIFLHERPTARAIVGAVVAFAGAAVLLWHG